MSRAASVIVMLLPPHCSKHSFLVVNTTNSTHPIPPTFLIILCSKGFLVWCPVPDPVHMASWFSTNSAHQTIQQMLVILTVSKFFVITNITTRISLYIGFPCVRGQSWECIPMVGIPAAEGSDWFTSLPLLPNHSLPKRNNPDRMPPACTGVPGHACPWYCILLKTWLLNLAGKALKTLNYTWS